MQRISIVCRLLLMKVFRIVADRKWARLLGIFSPSYRVLISSVSSMEFTDSVYVLYNIYMGSTRCLVSIERIGRAS